MIKRKGGSRKRPKVNFYQTPQVDTSMLSNHDIKAEKVRLISSEKEMLGIMSLDEAIELAKKDGLDVIMVSPTADPPVCKVADGGKYKFEMKKKQKSQLKTSKKSITKVVSISYGIDVADLQNKINNIKKLLAEGYKVQISCNMPPRLRKFSDDVIVKFNKICEDLDEIASVQDEPTMATNKVLATLLPR